MSPSNHQQQTPVEHDGRGQLYLDAHSGADFVGRVLKHGAQERRPVRTPPRHCEVVSSHISKKGLFDQLTSEYGEGFAKQDVTFALNHVKDDYNAEAREAAESYLDSGHFSHNSLMDQLTSEYGEQFTSAGR